MKLKILLIILGLLVIGSGSYVAANTIFKPKPPKPPELIGFENLGTEATGSAEVKEDKPKGEKSKEEVKVAIFNNIAPSNNNNTKAKPYSSYKPIPLPTIEPVSPPKPITNPKSNSELDKASGAKMVEKIYRHYDHTRNLMSFLRGIRYSTNSFPLNYLDEAHLAIIVSISYDSSIQTNGSLAESALRNCQIADQYFNEDIQHFRNMVSLYLSGDISSANKELTLAGDSQKKGDNYSQACKSNLAALGFFP